MKLLFIHGRNMLPMTRAPGTTNITILKKNTICIQTGMVRTVNRRTDNTMIENEGQTVVLHKGYAVPVLLVAPV